MGYIEVDSPYEHQTEIGVLTLANVMDTKWRLELLDCGAKVRMCERTYFVLERLRAEELGRAKASYCFSMGRWDFSEDVNVDNVAVTFMLPDGQLYEIPAIPEGGDYRPRVPVRVMLLEP